MFLISTKSLFLLFLNVAVFVANIIVLLFAPYTMWTFAALGISSFAIWVEFHYNIKRVTPETIQQD